MGSFTVQENPLNREIRKYIEFCVQDRNADNLQKTFAASTCSLGLDVLPQAIFLTDTSKSDQSDDLRPLLKKAIGSDDVDMVTVTFKTSMMWGKGIMSKLVLRDADLGEDGDMFSRAKILRDLQSDEDCADLRSDLLQYINSTHRHVNTSNGNPQVIKYLFLTRYTFAIDEVSNCLQNERGTECQILEDGNVIIFALELFTFFNVKPFEVKTHKLVHVGNFEGSNKYEVVLK